MGKIDAQALVSKLVERKSTPYSDGDRLLINRVVWDEKELAGVLDVFDRDWFAGGYYIKKFQEALGDAFGGRYLLTNSGSTALETAVMILMKKGLLKPGNLVLHPALTFNTSAACFAKFGMVPLFVDSLQGTYNADPDQVVDIVRDFDVRAIVMPHILGNTTSMADLLGVAAERGIPIIGDSCDTLGTTYMGQEVGNFTPYTAYSFYGSHHITTAGVGGAIKVHNDEDYELAKSIIHWGRDWEAEQTFANRYSYLTLGSDYQMTEIQAAFGLAQLGKLVANNKRRAEVFSAMNTALFDAGLDEFFYFPWSHNGTEPSWFGFPLTIYENAPFTREELIGTLDKQFNIECRPMFSGNTLKQKAWQDVRCPRPYPLAFADVALKQSFFLPAWAMPPSAVERLIQSVIDAVGVMS